MERRSARPCGRSPSRDDAWCGGSTSTATHKAIWPVTVESTALCLVYQMDSYHYWERELKRHDFTLGQFGENFTVEGLADSEVSIGDRFRIGGAVFEVTQPRVTCYRVGIRMGEPRMAACWSRHRRPGFYLRVLEEGEVGAGDEIVRVAEGPERLSVAAADSLLYLPGAAKEDLERALRIPALSQGWKSSFESLLRQMLQPGSHKGNAGLASPEQMVTAAPGFRPLKVARIDRESSSVVSVVLEPADGRPLTVPQPGQFVVLRLRPDADAPQISRSYFTVRAAERQSLSHLRQGGAARARQHFREHAACHGRCLGGQAPRLAFVLGRGDRPVVLLSAGVGVTPVLAMLHSLAADASQRPVWWITERQWTGTSFCSRSTCFAGQAPSCATLRQLQPARRGRSARRGLRRYRPTHRRRPRTIGRTTRSRFLCVRAEHVSRGIHRRAGSWGVVSGRVHTEIFGSGSSVTPGVSKAPAPATARTCGVVRQWSTGLVLPCRPDGLLGFQISEPAGARGSL